MKKFIYSIFTLALATFTLASCEDVPAPYDYPTTETPGAVTPNRNPEGTGTEADPYNVDAALNFIEALGADVNSEGTIYVKGKVVEVKEEYGTQYGNGTFYIATDDKATERLYIFRALYLGNKKFANGDTQIKVGDDVVIAGQWVNFKGNTPETVTNKAYIYSLNGKKGSTTPEQPAGEAKGDGTQANPYNAVAAYKAAAALAAGVTSDEVYIKGIVSSIKDAATTVSKYGSITYSISEDGKTANEFSVYGGKYFNGEKFTSPDQLKVGQTVVVKGKLTNYKGNTPQFNTGSQIISIDGKTAPETNPGTGGGDTPATGNATVTKADNLVTLTAANVTPGSETQEIDLNAQGWKAGEKSPTITLSDGTVLKFEKNTGSNDPIFHTGTKGVRMYAQNTFTLTATRKVAKLVLECDVYTDSEKNTTVYVGNDQLACTVNGNTWTIVNDFEKNSGGTQLRIKKITITYAK